MASLVQDDKLLDPNNPQNQAGAQPQASGSGASPLVGGGSSAVGSGVSTAGIGAGGTNKWTNIQAYLNANKGVDTGATSMLNEKAGGQFDKERSDIESAAGQAKSQAQSQADVVNTAKANSQDWLQNATQSYQFQMPKGDGTPGGTTGTYQKGQPTPTYNPGDSEKFQEYAGKFQNALNAQYTAPKSFNYGLSADSQNYGSTLGSDDAFNQWLGDQYQNKAGGQLSAGQRELQKQLNISNEPLAQMRQSLLDKYAGLNKYKDETVQNTSNDLSKAESDFRNNQQSLRDFLTNQMTTADSLGSAAESDARQKYGQALNQDFSAWDTPVNLPGFDRGINSYKKLDEYLSPIVTNDPNWLQAHPDDKRAYDALQNFYADQTNKYAGVGENERRQYNAIADILGMSGNRKSKAFNVRS